MGLRIGVLGTTAGRLNAEFDAQTLALADFLAAGHHTMAYIGNIEGERGLVAAVGQALASRGAPVRCFAPVSARLADLPSHPRVERYVVRDPVDAAIRIAVDCDAFVVLPCDVANLVDLFMLLSRPETEGKVLVLANVDGVFDGLIDTVDKLAKLDDSAPASLLAESGAVDSARAAVELTHRLRRREGSTLTHNEMPAAGSKPPAGLPIGCGVEDEPASGCDRAAGGEVPSGVEEGQGRGLGRVVRVNLPVSRDQETDASA